MRPPVAPDVDDKSSFDIVTGAYPRSVFEPRLDEQLTRARAARTSVTVCLLDLDHFKSVNDAFGHARGDEVLRAVVDRTRRVLLGRGDVFRLGGDEFALVLPGADLAAGRAIADQVVAEVASCPVFGDPPVTVTLSIGIAVFPEDGDQRAALLGAADQRAYTAKRHGRNRAVAGEVVSGEEPATSRLLDRDEALASATRFLDQIVAHGPGTLAVRGPRGVGFTAFVQQVAMLAAMRGFSVHRLRTADLVRDRLGSRLGVHGDVPRGGHHDRAPVLVIGDGAGSWDSATALASRLATTGTPVGLVVAGWGDDADQVGFLNAPVRHVELCGWSPETLHVWLRGRLGGEPSDELVAEVHQASSGLPAKAERWVGSRTAAARLATDAGGKWHSCDASRPPQAERVVPRLRTVAPIPTIGRAAATDWVVELLHFERLVTLVGPGGIGKTTLAQAVAGAVVDAYADGVVIAPLATATTPAEVVAAVAAALNIGEQPSELLDEAVTRALHGRHLLLVLDNCEQVLDAALHVATWLEAAPRLTVLATSRERLRLGTERVYQVEPLSLMTPQCVTAATVPEALERSAALRLFTAAARRIGQRFELTNDNLSDALALCHQVDGLPLAIELAASRVDTYSVRDLVAAVGRSLDAVGPGPRDAPQRHQTLRAVVAWSSELLSDDERTVFLALSAFPGGCRQSGAQAVSPVVDTEAVLRALVDKSLLYTEHDSDDRTRYRMLETIRTYASESLAADVPAAEAVRARQVSYYTTVAADAGARLSGAQQPAEIALLRTETPNVRAVLAMTLDRGDVLSAARICRGLSRYWTDSGDATEGRHWLRRVIAASPTLPPDLLLPVLFAAGVLALDQGDPDEARRLTEEAVSTARAVCDQQGLIRALRLLARIAATTGRYEEAHQIFSESLETAKSVQNQTGVASALAELAELAVGLGNAEEALSLARESLAWFRGQGDLVAVATCLMLLGEAHAADGALDDAGGAFSESLEVSRTVGSACCEAWALHDLGALALLRGELPEAGKLLGSALGLRYEIQEYLTVPDSVEALGLAAAAGWPQDAARMFAAADALRARCGVVRPPASAAQIKRARRAVRARLTEAEFVEASTVGGTLSFERAVEDAASISDRLAARLPQLA